MIGSTTTCPIRSRYRASSGFTAIAVSPSIVSGRVVATVTPGAPSLPGYRTYHSLPVLAWCTTSRSDSAVRHRGHQLTM